MNYGIPNLNADVKKITREDYPKIRNCLDDINCILEMEEIPKEYFEFVKSTKDATTDVPARTTRCEFIVKENVGGTINKNGYIRGTGQEPRLHIGKISKGM